jgi:hypothetical protein
MQVFAELMMKNQHTKLSKLLAEMVSLSYSAVLMGKAGFNLAMDSEMQVAKYN